MWKLRTGAARLHAATFIIAPMTPHRLAPTAARVISLFAPVDLPFGRRLAGGFSRRSISAAPELAQFLRKAAHVDAAHGAIGELDDALGLAQAPGVDERLAIAVSAAVEDGLSISAAASRIGLTGAGLRALSHREIGAGPARAVLWRKLVAAMRALSAGASAAEAAHAGGFADQSHFNRTMRLTFGLTPGAVAAIIAGD